MNRRVGVGVAIGGLLPARAVGLIDPSNVRRRLIALALAGVVCGLFFASKSTAQADETAAGATYSALRNYVQQIGAEDIQPVGVRKTSEDDAFAALRDFARRIPDGRPTEIKSGQITVAEADNAFDALREFLQKQNGNQSTPAPAEIPKQPTTPTKPQQPEVAASYVGTKVCLGCHTSQATTFEHTLMGRLAEAGQAAMRILPWAGLGAREARRRAAASAASFRSARMTPAGRRKRTMQSVLAATSAVIGPIGTVACTRRAVSPAPIATPS